MDATRVPGNSAEHRYQYQSIRIQRVHAGGGGNSTLHEDTATSEMSTRYPLSAEPIGAANILIVSGEMEDGERYEHIGSFSPFWTPEA